MADDKGSKDSVLTDDDEPLTRADLHDLTAKVQRLTDSIDYFLRNLDAHMHTLIEATIGKTPPGCVPIETHRLVVKGLIYAFTVILIVAIGAVKVLPYVMSGIR